MINILIIVKIDIHRCNGRSAGTDEGPPPTGYPPIADPAELSVAAMGGYRHDKANMVGFDPIKGRIP